MSQVNRALLPFMLIIRHKEVCLTQVEYVLDMRNGSIEKYLCTKKPPVAVFLGVINVNGFALQDARSADACWYFFSR
ncbi:hypothetical protein PS676_03405 [Pseudomonas fluorescens]|nr:hypothetical protein PS676_03405 [Pseudomonas fluorescens]